MWLKRTLLDHGANIEAENKTSDRPLHIASLFGHANCVELFVKLKTDIEATGQRGWTALANAALFELEKVNV